MLSQGGNTASSNSGRVFFYTDVNIAMGLIFNHITFASMKAEVASEIPVQYTTESF